MNRPLYGEMEDKMTREAVFETLNEVFRDVFDDENISVTDNTCLLYTSMCIRDSPDGHY